MSVSQSQNGVPNFDGFFAADLPLVPVEFTIRGEPCKLWGRPLDAADSEEFFRRVDSEASLRELYEWMFPRVFRKGHVVQKDAQTGEWVRIELPAAAEERAAFFAPADPEKRLPKPVFDWLATQANLICGYLEPAKGESSASSG